MKAKQIVRVLIPLALVVCALIVAFFISKSLTKHDAIPANDNLTVADGSVYHDYQINNKTVADFSIPIIEKESQEKRLIVREAVLNDTITITNTGFANWKILKSCQEIKVKGYATYTIDLSELTEECFDLNPSSKQLTIRIPFAVLDQLNVPSEEMTFKDVEQGSILSPKEINLTPEENANLIVEATSRMKAQLIDKKTADRANEDAKAVTQELFQQVVNAIDPEYTVIVVQ